MEREERTMEIAIDVFDSYVKNTLKRTNYIEITDTIIDEDIVKINAFDNESVYLMSIINDNITSVCVLDNEIDNLDEIIGNFMGY